MGDVFTRQRRSEIMRHIGSKDTAPEKRVRSIIHGMGYRFRLHGKDLPGTPDLVFPKRRKVIFVHGCFWHGGHSGCRRATIPSTRREFWREKIEGNSKRDCRTRQELKRLGWDCLVVWQCEIRKGTEERLREKLSRFLDT